VQAMGIVGTTGRIALGAAASGLAAGAALSATGAAAQRGRDQRAALNAERHVTEWARAGDAPSDNLDGTLRIAALGGSAVALATAGVVRVLGHRSGAALLAGGALGVAGAALLATGEPIAQGPPRAARSMLEMVSGLAHEAHPRERPNLEALGARSPVPEPNRRPAAHALASASLQLLPGTPDEARAQRDAEQALARIDWSKPDIVLWMPGTMDHTMGGGWSDEVEHHMARPASAVLVDYPATADFATSVATGMRTLQLVLAGIAEHGGEHRVLAGGYSQGAWIVGDALATPEIAASIDRAVLFGHPGLAVRHYDEDPRVLEVNDPNDAIANPSPDRELLMRAMADLEHGEALAHPLRALTAFAQNPELGVVWSARSGDSARWAGSDPHEYYDLYRDGVRWLDGAPPPA
jgi:hypothetical protein